MLPHTARMMLKYAESIAFLNTGSRQTYFQTRCDNERRIDRVEERKSSIIQGYGLVLKKLGFGGNCYQAIVKAGQAVPYLLFHLHSHLHIAFLTQESLAGEDRPIQSPEIHHEHADLCRVD